MLFNQSIIPIYPETIDLGLINAFNNISNKNGDNPYQIISIDNNPDYNIIYSLNI